MHDFSTGKKDIARLHEQGHLAIHITPDPAGSLFEKIEDRRIINNLREDGGTTERDREDYAFHPIISTTVLPPTKYSVTQNLYDFSGKIFVGIDMENCLVKSFSHVDSQSTYWAKNSKGRPTYKAIANIRKDLAELPHEERLPYVDKENIRSAQYVSTPRKKGARLFSSSEPNFKRGMNEALLKVTNNSMVFIGALASDVKDHPDLLLKLMLIKQQLKEKSGIEYPIYIYNNQPEPVVLNVLEPHPIEINPNQFCEVDVESALKQLISKYPDSIEMTPLTRFHEVENMSTHEFLEQIGFELTDNNEPKRKAHLNSDANENMKRGEYSNTIENLLDAFNAKLKPFSEEDAVLQIHHPDAPLHEQYPEINQKNLGKFIKTRVMGIGESDILTNEQNQAFKYYMNAYNAQFRLDVYREMLKSGTMINYPNLDKDIKWSSTLLSKAVDNQLNQQELQKRQNHKANATGEALHTAANRLLGIKESVKDAFSNLKPNARQTRKERDNLVQSLDAFVKSNFQSDHTAIGFDRVKQNDVAKIRNFINDIKAIRNFRGLKNINGEIDALMKSLSHEQIKQQLISLFEKYAPKLGGQVQSPVAPAQVIPAAVTPLPVFQSAEPAAESPATPVLSQQGPSQLSGFHVYQSQHSNPLFIHAPANTEVVQEYRELLQLISDKRDEYRRSEDGNRRGDLRQEIFDKTTQRINMIRDNPGIEEAAQKSENKIKPRK